MPKKSRPKTKAKRKPAKRRPKEDFNQAAFRVVQEVTEDRLQQKGATRKVKPELKPGQYYATDSDVFQTDKDLKDYRDLLKKYKKQEAAKKAEKKTS